jgi:hypothetical protein
MLLLLGEYGKALAVVIKVEISCSVLALTIKIAYYGIVSAYVIQIFQLYELPNDYI